MEALTYFKGLLWGFIDNILLGGIQVDPLLFAVAQAPAQAVELWRKQSTSTGRSQQGLGPRSREIKKERGTWPLRTNKNIDCQFPSTAFYLNMSGT